MQGHRRRTSDPQAGAPRLPATPISPKGGGGTASISLSLLLHDVTDIASLSLRELDAVALATIVTVFMERETLGQVVVSYGLGNEQRRVLCQVGDSGFV